VARTGGGDVNAALAIAPPSPAARRARDLLGLCAVGCALFIPIGKAPFNAFFALGVLACLACVVLERDLPRRLLRDPVVAGGIALFVLYAASMLWSSAPPGPAVAQLSSYRVLLMPLLFGAALAEPRWRDRVLAALLASLALVLVLGWIQAAWPLPFAKATHETNRFWPDGTWIAPDVYVFSDRIRQSVHLSLLLLWAAGTALLEAAPSPRLRTALALLAIATAIQMLWLLQGRTGWLASAGVLLYLMHARGGWRLVGGAALAAALLAAGTIGGLGGSQRLADTAGELRAYRDRGAFNATGERIEMWSNAARMIAASPILGHGIESYPTMSADMYRAKRRESAPVYHDPHQEFLYVGAELGAVGLVLLLGGLVALWRRAGRFDDRWRWLVRGCVVVYVAAGLVNCLLNVGWTGYHFGLLLALAAGRSLDARGQGAT
jgi:O-antigen ligase